MNKLEIKIKAKQEDFIKWLNGKVLDEPILIVSAKTDKETIEHYLHFNISLTEPDGLRSNAVENYRGFYSSPANGSNFEIHAEIFTSHELHATPLSEETHPSEQPEIYLENGRVIEGKTYQLGENLKIVMMFNELGWGEQEGIKTKAKDWLKCLTLPLTVQSVIA